MSNPLWWIADNDKAIARIDAAIVGKADSDMVRLPLGDARPELVSVHKQRREKMVQALCDAIHEYGIDAVNAARGK